MDNWGPESTFKRGVDLKIYEQQTANKIDREKQGEKANSNE
jgi:hypothetical protein